MNEFQQPRRWVSGAEGAPRDLVAWLEAAERDLPDESELAALGLLGPPPGLAGPETGGTATGGTATGGTVAKQTSFALVKWGSGVLLVGSGIWVATHTLEDRSPAPNEPRGAQAPSSAPSATPPVSNSALTAPQPSALRIELAQQGGAPASRAQAKEPVRNPAEPSELALLRAARAALARAPADALRLTEEHARRFAGGRLVQEREVIRIKALQRLGRTKEAELRQREFDVRFPGSAHRRKLNEPHE